VSRSTRFVGLATVVAAAALVAGASGGAGATSSPASATTAGPSAVKRGAASSRAALLRQANLRTLAGVRRYLRAIGINPRGVVIQRSVRNYAGPRCPGAGWACTSTAHPVVQIAGAGGKNSFLCATGNCAVVQTTRSRAAKTARALTAAAATTNNAKCIKTTGLTQSCSISQTSATADNEAIVVEGQVAGAKMSGLTQTASYSAQITQTATGGSSVHNGNTACVLQIVNVDGSTQAKNGVPVLVTLNGQQSVSISQDSLYGNNVVKNATTNGTCDSDGTRLTQSQTLSSSANGSAKIEQDENATATAPNIQLDIKQNKNQTTPADSVGENHVWFSQSSNLSAVAGTPSGPVIQKQSTDAGGIQATVNQFAHGISTSDALQTEIQCEHAQIGPVSSTSSCTAGTPPSYTLTQEQHGPLRKGGDPSTQGDNPGDTFTIKQNSTQDNDTHSDQTNTVQADCTTSGGCTATQTTTENGGPPTTHTASGSTVNTGTNCTGGSCTTSTTSGFVSGDVLVSIGNGLVEERSPSGALVRTLDTGKGNGVFTTGLAFDAAKNLYVADFNANDVSKIASDGSASSFGGGYNSDPESIVFDSAGNAYVGQADGSRSVLEFSRSGAPLATFSPATGNRGTDWIDLAPDGCTLYYTSEGTSVKRFDVCTSTQLTDFATNLPGPGAAFAIKLLPAGGGALVADSDSIVRLNNTGAVVQQYGTGETQSGGNWFSVALDPDGTSFWAGDGNTGKVTRFNLATGNVLASFTTGGTLQFGRADGLVVVP